jgi:UDP-sulfoquinovose synthase
MPARESFALRGLEGGGMRVLVLGGDGYLGWPTAMRLSKVGHEVMAVDSYLRRRLCREHGAEPLFDVPELPARRDLWREKSGREIAVGIGDLREWGFISEVFRSFRPQAVVHYAEQPSAPFSMLDRSCAMLTLQNNLEVTLNVIYAVREFAPECHIVKLGTMGEYGTPNIDIEEGWIEIEHKGRKDRFLFPRQAGSLYHVTKVMDTDLLWLYVRAWGLRVTDLMQGPVYGFETYENEGDVGLYPLLNYDDIFGTVINRFIVQAVQGFPLTVYGAGGQTRGFINLKDTLGCIELAIDNPADRELRVFNQFVETFSISDIAQRVVSAARQLGITVTVQTVPNPRKEAEKHYYNPAHTGLLSLGLKPHLLTEEVLVSFMRTVMRYRGRIDPSKFLRGTRWN